MSDSLAPPPPLVLPNDAISAKFTDPPPALSLSFIMEAPPQLPKIIEEDVAKASPKSTKQKQAQPEVKSASRESSASSFSDPNDLPPPPVPIIEEKKTFTKGDNYSPEMEINPSVTHIHLVNNPIYSDVNFLINGQKIFGHFFILQFRAKSLLAGGKKKKGILEVEIPQEKGISAQIIIEILKFVYSGRIDFTPLKETEIIQVQAVASHFEGFERLHWLCETHIQQNINMTNAYTILRVAGFYNQTALKEFAIRFAVEHYVQYVANKEGVKELGMDTFQELVVAYQTAQGHPLPPLAKRDEPQATYVRDLRNLLKSMSETDITFKMVDANVLGISGSLFRCHKAIVASRNTLLTNLCEKTPVVGTSKDVPVVEVKGITTDGFEALLNYLYYGERLIPIHGAIELISFCRDYQLAELMQYSIESLEHGIAVETVLTVLNLCHKKDMPDFYMKAMKELKPKCIQFMVENFVKIDLRIIERGQSHPSTGYDILRAIQKVGQKKELKPKKKSKTMKKKKKTWAKWLRVSTPVGNRDPTSFLFRGAAEYATVYPDLFYAKLQRKKKGNKKKKLRLQDDNNTNSNTEEPEEKEEE